MNFDVPILGLCLGHEIITVAYRGRIKKLPAPMNTKEKIRILDINDPIFSGLNTTEIFIKKRHTNYVSDLPEVFMNLAESDCCPYEIIRHKDKSIYGFQGHPEVSGPDGLIIMKNFLDICNIGGTK